MWTGLALGEVELGEVSVYFLALQSLIPGNCCRRQTEGRRQHCQLHELPYHARGIVIGCLYFEKAAIVCGLVGGKKVGKRGGYFGMHFRNKCSFAYLYTQAEEETQSLQLQLMAALEEASVVGKKSAEAADEVDRYRREMTTLFDQRNMLYRDYARAMASWKAEKKTLASKVNLNVPGICTVDRPVMP